MLMIANTCCTAASEDTIPHQEKGGSGVRETKAAGYYRENRGTHSLGSRIVVSIKPRKPEEIIICVDMRQVNPAVKRKRHTHYKRHQTRSKWISYILEVGP